MSILIKQYQQELTHVSKQSDDSVIKVSSYSSGIIFNSHLQVSWSG